MLSVELSILNSDHLISKPTHSAGSDDFSQTQNPYREQESYRKKMKKSNDPKLQQIK